MNTGKIIFVTGATGRQGSAAASHLARNGFGVKALARNINSPSLAALRKLNVEIVQGDLNDVNSFSGYLNGVYGVFCALTFKYGTDKETSQGITLADLSKENEVSHFVYSSVIGADLHTGIPHWESKYKIETHIKQSRLPYTIIRPSSFYENFLLPDVKKRIQKGIFPSPLDKSTVQQLISTDDIGKIATAVLSDSQKYLNSEFAAATEQMSIGEVVDLFSEILNKPMRFQKMPGFITRLALGKNIYKMMKWVNHHDNIFVKNMEGFREEFPGLVSLKVWVIKNF